MKLFRSRSLGPCLLAMLLVLAIIATLLGASTVFQHSRWLILIGLALFVLAGMPALRDLMGPSSAESLGVERRISGRRTSNSLFAVSAAAILAVYAAGYDRTNSAADRLEELTSIPRRHVVSDVVPEVAVSAAPAASTAPTNAGPAVDKVSERVEQQTAPAAAIASPGIPSPRRAEEEVASTDTIQPAPPAVEAVALTATAPETLAAEPAPAPLPVAAPAPPVPALPQYNDGSYLGWGTCRHGSLQVQVVIQAGKIFSADITQCRTRYSCSVIQNTPSQLVARQNPDKIDNVTGATQSVDAYYFAVTEALKEAAKPLK